MIKKLFFPILCYLLLAFFVLLMLRITLPYLALHDEVGFLRIKRQVIHLPVWKLSFYLHVFSSIFVLLAGFTQFSSTLRRNYPKIHKLMGKVYVAIILLISGPAGLVMSLYANGGWPSRLAFSLLSLLWLFTTWKAYVSARQKQWQAHRDFMLRSYALTLSALSLRAWKWLLVLLLRPQPMDVYMIVAWLGWLPNLLLIEWWIKNKFGLSQNLFTKFQRY